MKALRLARPKLSPAGVVHLATGKALGDSKFVADGKGGKAKGKIQNAVGGLKDALKK